MIYKESNLYGQSVFTVRAFLKAATVGAQFGAWFPTNPESVSANHTANSTRIQALKNYLPTI